MRTINLIIIALISINSTLVSQIQLSGSNENGLVTVLEPQKFHLNSQGKSFIGGNSYIVVKLDLPENTKEWYYYVCASNDDSNYFIGLTKQLAKQINNKIINLSDIKIKSGNSQCEIYVLDTENKDKFLKDEVFDYNNEISRTNFNSGIVKVKYNPEENWLLIKNPRKIHAVDIALEVAARLN